MRRWVLLCVFFSIAHGGDFYNRTERERMLIREHIFEGNLKFLSDDHVYAGSAPSKRHIGEDRISTSTEVSTTDGNQTTEASLKCKERIAFCHELFQWNLSDPMREFPPGRQCHRILYELIPCMDQMENLTEEGWGLMQCAESVEEAMQSVRFYNEICRNLPHIKDEECYLERLDVCVSNFDEKRCDSACGGIPAETNPPTTNVPVETPAFKSAPEVEEKKSVATSPIPTHFLLPLIPPLLLFN